MLGESYSIDGGIPRHYAMNGFDLRSQWQSTEHAQCIPVSVLLIVPTQLGDL